MKRSGICACFFLGIFFLAGSCFAQVDSNAKAKGLNTPDSLLDFRLSHAQFLYYYGTDDTSRALINMFFRKRSFYPIGNDKSADKVCLWVGVTVAAYMIVIPVLGIRTAINCTTYSRQQLLYVLLDYENGYPVPDAYIDKLRPEDFRY